MKQPALQIETLRKRRDFLATRGGARISGRFFAVQCRRRSAVPGSSDLPGLPVPPEASPKTLPSARFGLTVTKKTGNGVERNRIKRRLRAAIDAQAPGRALAGFDYVVFAHRATLHGEFTAISQELAKSLDRARTFKEKAGKEKAGKEKAGKEKAGHIKNGKEQNGPIRTGKNKTGPKKVGKNKTCN